MRIQWIPIIAIIIANLGIDAALWRWLRRPGTSLRGLKSGLHAALSVAMLALMVTAISIPNRRVDNATLVAVMWMLFAYFSVCVPRWVSLLLWQLGRLRCLGTGGRRAVHTAAVAAGMALCGVMWWGALVTPRTVKVERVGFESAKLPASFDGYRVVQISDLHVGTYGTDTAAVSMFVDSVNALKPDLICFTGDLVNRQTSEAEPFKPVLSRLRARHGVMAVLGNHDYDDYRTWPTQAQKEADRKALVRLEQGLGWTVLNNATCPIGLGGDSIDVIGAENYGDPPFHTYGSLAATHNDLANGRFKLLLQHNPYEWRADVAGKTPVDLMLSGHTHAMQIMLTIGRHRLSPARLRYREWGGLYTEGGQALYVNIGLGMVAMPMRIGATPDITLITVRAKH